MNGHHLADSVPPILREAEELIVKGIAWSTFLHVLILLLPQALSLTIPMSVLLGILIGFGRLSADRAQPRGRRYSR